MKKMYMKAKYFILFILFVIVNTQLYPQLTSPSDADYGLYGIWARRAPFGSGGNAEIKSSVTDENGNVYLSGVFEGTLNFSDDICNPVMSSLSSGKGLYLLKLDKDGKYVWHIIYEVSQGIPESPQNGLESIIYDYKDGKLLLYGRFNYQGIMPQLGVKVIFNDGGSSNTVEYTKPTNSTNYDRFSFQFLHVVNMNDGSTNLFLDPFTSVTQNLTASFEGNDIHALHMGWDGSVYINNQSLLSIFGPDGVQKGSNFAYPNQPYASPGAPGSASTIIRHITLADGRQVMVHNSFGKADPIDNIPSYYLLYYNNDYTAKENQFLMSERAIEFYPFLATDNSSNVYITTNYGKSQYWNSYDYEDPNIPNSNHLDNFLNSGNDYWTPPQVNKVVVSRMNSDYSIKWMFQIGRENDVTDPTAIIARDMKTIGNYTYVIGQFIGNDINFNPLADDPNNNPWILQNAGNGPPNYRWNFDVFYAVYDNETGKCVYAVNIGGLGQDDGSALHLSPDGSQVLIGGAYDSDVFQPDPSGRLFELTGSGSNSYGFVARYSTDPNSQPAPYLSSFGDAPADYGTAVHHIYECIYLGDVYDMSSLQSEPDFSVDANTALNDNGIDIDNIKTDGFIDLNHVDFRLDPSSGDLNVKVKVNNTAPSGDNAKVIGWIDFNQNGVFDGADEASSVIIIPAGTSNSFKTLTWSGAKNKLKNGTTYLRLRITTDLMDNTQPQGLFFNGEVEDYRLDFNLLELEKTAVSNNTIDQSTADIGDTISYTISLSNKYREDILLFDPIPEGTVYYDSDPAGTLTNISLNGNTVQAITWNLPNLEVGDYTYKFRAIVTGKPENSDSIVNIAYATIYGDTVTSSDASNNFAAIDVNKVRLTNDTVYLCEGSTIEIDVLANDYYLPTCDATPNISLNPKFGSASVNTDNKIVYTSNNGFDGNDTIKYTIECSGGVQEASIIIYIYDKPEVTGFSDLSICIGEEVGDILLSSNISGTVFDWTGGSSAGLQDGTSTDLIPGFKVLGVSTTVYITPQYDYPIFTCIGDVKSFDITIKAPDYSDIDQNEYLWTGVSISGNSWNIAENWLMFDGSEYVTVNEAPQVTTNVRIMGYNDCVIDPIIISDEKSVCNDLTITNANLILNNSQLKVYANWNNDGVFTPDDNTTIIFTGQSQTNRTIKSNNSSFTNIEFDFDGELDLSDALTITRSGEFSNGIAHGNAVFMENSTSVIPENSTSFINGEITKYGIGLFVFPLGDINVRTFNPSFQDVEYTIVGRLGITPNSSSSVPEIKATYIYDNTGMPNWWHTSNNMEAGLHHVSDREYWKLSSNVDVENITLHWQNNTFCEENHEADVCPHGFCTNEHIGQVDLNSLTIAVSDGGKWRSLNSENSGNHDKGYLQSFEKIVLEGQESSFNSAVFASQPLFVTFGALDESIPLPIELLDFKANALEESIMLTWITVNEINNDYFEIERSIDAVNFEKISQIKGAGFSNSILYYYDEDLNVEPGVLYYYRLKQVDFDENYKYFPIKSAVIKKDISNFSFYPNPASDYIELVIDSNEFYYEIINNSGQSILNGKNNKTINISQLPSGLYIILVVVGDNTLHERLIKE